MKCSGPSVAFEFRGDGSVKVKRIPIAFPTCILLVVDEHTIARLTVAVHSSSSSVVYGSGNCM